MFVPLNIHSIKSFIGIIHFSESLKKKEEGVKKKKHQKKDQMFCKIK